MKNIFMSASLLTVFFVSQGHANAAEVEYNPTVNVGQTIHHLANDNEPQELHCIVLSNSTASVSTRRDPTLFAGPVYIDIKGLQAGSTDYACHLGSDSGPISIRGVITVH